MDLSPARAKALRRWGPDLALAGAVFAFDVIGAAIVGAQRGEPNLTVAATAVLLVQCVPLVWRRRAPIAVWAIVGIATAVYGLADWPDPLLPLSAFVALATVVECCSRRSAALVWLVSAAAGTATLLAASDSDALDVWVAVVMLIVAPLLGDHQRNRNAYLRQLEDAAERTAEEQRRQVRAAQLAERAHLARELHDVVAHNVSMIVVQAEAGASAAASAAANATTAPSSDTASGPTAATFDAIASLGRSTLNELRVLLGVLRTDEPRAPVAPQPGIDDIEDLVSRVRETGMAVDLRIEGVPRPLRPAVDLSAYRIVQEGLTNVLKHSDASRAEVTVRFDPWALSLRVRDDGCQRPSTSPPGHGLDGLRERVALLRGTLTAGRHDAGGFELAVSLPVDG